MHDQEHRCATYFHVDTFSRKASARLIGAGIVKGAESVAPLAAASVVCKCLLDDQMLELDEHFPQYG
jgi:ribonuclease HII